MASQVGTTAPSVRSATEAGRVNVPGMAGAVWWPLFDTQTIAAGGVAQQTFFSVPVGGGTPSKTETQTNMELSGQIPAGRRFVITGLGIDFFPGVNISTTETPIAAAQFANDVYAFNSGGRVKLTIGAKDFINHGPLMRFPSQNRLDVDSAVSAIDSDEAAGLVVSSSYAAAGGRGYATFDTVLMANQNFSVTLYDIPALPSGEVATAVVSLYGWLYRNAQ